MAVTDAGAAAKKAAGRKDAEVSEAAPSCLVCGQGSAIRAFERVRYSVAHEGIHASPCDHSTSPYRSAGASVRTRETTSRTVAADAELCGEGHACKVLVTEAVTYTRRGFPSGVST